jgi:hypothetical protein
MSNINVIVHKFRMADVEDPQLYAAEPLYKWEHSEPGQWIMKNSIETPTWNLVPNLDIYGHEVIIKAVLKPEDYTYWKLKYE